MESMVQIAMGAFTALNTFVLALLGIYIAQMRADRKELKDELTIHTDRIANNRSDIKTAMAVHNERMKAIDELAQGVKDLTKEIKEMKEYYNTTFQEFFTKYNVSEK